MIFSNIKTSTIKTENIWECFLCERKHPNTLRHCPYCNIAKTHSDNLRKTAEKKKLRMVAETLSRNKSK